MNFDARKTCTICAWREKCTKKFKMEEGSLHCADFTKDKSIATSEEKSEEKPKRSMKVVEDVFGD